MQSQERLSWLPYILPGSRGTPPSIQLSSASQSELSDMMHGETGDLLELRRELEKEMNSISVEFVSSSNFMKVESYLLMIRDLKDDYQDAIELLVDKYNNKRKLEAITVRFHIVTLCKFLRMNIKPLSI